MSDYCVTGNAFLNREFGTQNNESYVDYYLHCSDQSPPFDDVLQSAEGLIKMANASYEDALKRNDTVTLTIHLCKASFGIAS